MNVLLRQALRVFCLPLAPTEESVASTALDVFFKNQGIVESEYFAWAKLQIGLWKDDGRPTKLLTEAVQNVLESIKDTSYRVHSKSYFAIHKQLQVEYRFSHSDATAFLSHLRIARELAISHRLSAARLTYILSQLDGRIHFSSQNIRMALRKIGYITAISQEQMETLFISDRDGEVELFADAELHVGADFVSANANELGYRGDLRSDLLVLASEPNNNKHIAHLQVLHYQCCILEFYDHSAFDLYEFQPRGTVANWLFAKYPQSLASSGNPFLNIAKSVSILNRSWVDSKESLRPAALSLYNILASLDELSYAERREVAMQIRRWIFLFFRLSGDTPTALPGTIDQITFASLLTKIAAGNTKTFGVLEQRVVDVVSSTRFHDVNWRPRGLSDSVNATNVSHRKLGDCDFQNSVTREIEAFESHGGKLTKTYIDEHIRTLQKVIPLRLAEITAVANKEDWQATVTFVAQKVDCDVPPEITIQGFTIRFRIDTFSNFSFVGDSCSLDLAVRKFFLEPLRERRTPEAVRQKLKELLGS